MEKEVEVGWDSSFGSTTWIICAVSLHFFVPMFTFFSFVSLSLTVYDIIVFPRVNFSKRSVFVCTTFTNTVNITCLDFKCPLVHLLARSLKNRRRWFNTRPAGENLNHLINKMCFPSPALAHQRTVTAIFLQLVRQDKFVSTHYMCWCPKQQFPFCSCGIHTHTLRICLEDFTMCSTILPLLQCKFCTVSDVRE